MKCPPNLKPVLVSLLVAGCASSPKLLPKNEINKPVFHQTDFIALGAASGPSWARREGSGTFRDSIYFIPNFNYEIKVNDWASYTLLPVLWNLRMTGEQYSDSAHLKLRKLHVAFHGGISGLAFSSRDGWVSSGLIALESKYLIDRKWFLGALLLGEMDDLGDWGRRTNRLSIGIGAQVSDRNSLKMAYSLSRFELPRYRAFNIGGYYHFDGDTRTELDLRHTYYAWRKHVLGSEIGFDYRNYSVSKTGQFSIGVHYAYMFD